MASFNDIDNVEQAGMGGNESVDFFLSKNYS